MDLTTDTAQDMHASWSDPARGRCYPKHVMYRAAVEVVSKALPFETALPEPSVSTNTERDPSIIECLKAVHTVTKAN